MAFPVKRACSADADAAQDRGEPGCREARDACLRADRAAEDDRGEEEAQRLLPVPDAVAALFPAMDDDRSHRVELIAAVAGPEGDHDAASKAEDERGERARKGRQICSGAVPDERLETVDQPEHEPGADACHIAWHSSQKDQ